MNEYQRVPESSRSTHIHLPCAPAPRGNSLSSSGAGDFNAAISAAAVDYNYLSRRRTEAKRVKGRPDGPLFVEHRDDY
jgi:hypothetical protein